MTDEFEEEIFGEMDDIRGDNRVAIPGVGHIHRQVATQQRRAGFALAALVIAGVAGFWATRTDSTELATGDEAVTADTMQAQSSNDAGSVADDSAPTQIAPLSETRLRLAATPSWFVVASEGVPDSEFRDAVSFVDNHIILGSCLGAPYDIEWTQDGFTVVRPTPIDPSVPVPLIGCPEPSGMQLATMRPGLSVSAFANSDGTIDLVSAEWKVTLSANPDNDALFIYRSLPEAEAAALAEERGWRWRVVHRDGVDLGYTFDYDGKRLNFSVRDGIVIHVRTDDELGTPEAPQVTTTTIVAGPTGQYLSLTVEEAVALADSNGLRWRLVRIDGEDQRVTSDLRPGRLNFVVEDNVVVEVIVEDDTRATPQGDEQPIAVPMVDGSVIDAAVAEIEAAGLVAEIRFGDFPNGVAEHVIRTDPPADAGVGRGSTVVLIAQKPVEDQGDIEGAPFIALEQLIVDNQDIFVGYYVQDGLRVVRTSPSADIANARAMLENIPNLEFTVSPCTRSREQLAGIVDDLKEFAQQIELDSPTLYGIDAESCAVLFGATLSPELEGQFAAEFGNSVIIDPNFSLLRAPLTPDE